ncbi:putative glucose-6-phosphate dehydrogenase [Actinoplanes missouriensis 431]|uniref:Putative glucose-6-phosphate dehydrogenase n=1 Tax=Actinoplanes missouriensis (strain ATCC 14538 / DSM 43046 / CBS 188.64 / JCM 3121 / NBRC 102363 / NCIMB 12654 / NRRL B-3342 / UNCC 431) TaxID=512565 RepID=I0HDI1_ACTM4|nr:glucose-6-phosphate dehydrogenase [Actinoplanes missouriensis]BAL91068.1 putative glucose-6-phosphate dehydrogenase [Actinoplanes missouriensis 431]
MTDQTLIILGASGDLTARLLLPGVGALIKAGHVPGLTLIGAALDEDWDDARWQQRVRDSAGQTPPSRWIRADVTRADDLRTVLGAAEGPPAIFFALPPAVTARACAALLDVDLPEGTRLVLEKPFGTSAESAAELNALLTRLVPEDRIHRVDHFLGKSTVLNILGVRFANRIFEPLLNSTHVASVDIVFDENLGLENRAGYYDRAGALADMIQSHLLQILGILTMEPPISLDTGEFRDRKADALRATRLWGEDPAACSRRARYTAGDLSGRHLPGYADEPGVDPSRETETLAELVLTVDTWRWAGVPFRLRSGKAIGNSRKEAVITFKRPPRVPDGLTGCDEPDRLRITFGPDRIALDFNINGPGDPFELDPVSLSAEFGAGELPPYGEVLRGVFEDDPTLSIRADVAEQCWRIVEPVTAAWRAGAVPLLDYPAGSAGPEDSLLTS